MEGFFTSIIPVLIIISIVSSIINNAKKNQQKSNNKQKTTPQRSGSLQSIIRDQINQQKESLVEQFAPQPTNTPKKEFVESRFSEGDRLDRKTLEGVPVEHQRHKHDAHIGGSYNEGDELNRDTLEGTTLEGGFSYGEDDMSLDVLTLDDSDVLSVQKIRKTKQPRKSLQNSGIYKELKMNRDSIVNGVIMAEILEKRGGRRSI